MDKYTCVWVKEDSREEDLACLIDSMAQNGSRLSEDWSGTDAANMLRRIVDIPTFPREFTVFIEAGYVDRIYRDIYYHHYASRHFSQPRNCQRLFFFKGVDQQPGILPDDAEERFIGVSVIQPNGIIGRSYWNPKYFLEPEHYVRTVSFSVTLLGRPLRVNAFPYMMQDREATTCAEVTVLNLVDYYSQSYMEYRAPLLSDIENVEAQHSAERIFPSRGMNYTDVARSLAQAGLSPRLYVNRSSSMTKDTMHRYLYYYVESGIPFGVAVESSEPGLLHSMVCVGHGPRDKSWPKDRAANYIAKESDGSGGAKLRTCWIANSADAYPSFVVMDDNDRPYQTVRLEAASKSWTFPGKQGENAPVRYAVQQLCVPLYKRVFLEIDGAAEVFATFLTSRKGYQAVMEHSGLDQWLRVGQSEDEPLIVRIFLASSRTFLKQRMRTLREMDPQEMDERCVEVYQNLFCPRFVWVCELYTKDSFQADDPKAIGEIVVDATARRTGSMGGLDSIVLVHYPHYLTYRDPDSSWAELESNEQHFDTWTPFTQFRGNLQDVRSEDF